MKRTYLAGALAAAGLIAAAVFPLPRLAHGEVTQGGSYTAEYTCCTDFSGLTKQGIVVVLGRVVANSPSYVVHYDRPVTTIDAAPQLSGPKATAVAAAPPPTPDANATQPPDPGVALTDSTIQVLETWRGNAAQTDRTLTVTQAGGTDAQGQQVRQVDDPLLQVGQEEVLFLAPIPGTGKYSTVGGPQGRFPVGPTGTVQALDQGAGSYTKAYNGLTLAALKAAVRAVQ